MDAEEIAVGWWPGDARYPRDPRVAHWEPALGEFVLDWDAVVVADDPHATALAFARSVVAHACTACGWDPRIAASVHGSPPPVA
jgi:hypothetical protein